MLLIAKPCQCEYQANIDIYLHNPVGIGEHPDILAAIQDQIDLIAKEEERLDVLEKHFGD